MSTSDSGRKINEQYENPIDNMIYKFIVVPLSPHLHNLGFTPNMLTFMSAMTQFYSIYCLQNNEFHLFSIFYILGYIFDCFDGYIARKYDQVTNFGDLFDHVTDIGAVSLLAYVAFQKWGIHCNYIIYLFYLCSFLLLGMHMGCQQKMYKKKDSSKMEETLDSLSIMCPFNDTLISKYFGSGTMYLLLAIIPSLLKKCDV